MSASPHNPLQQEIAIRCSFSAFCSLLGTGKLFFLLSQYQMGWSCKGKHPLRVHPKPTQRQGNKSWSILSPDIPLAGGRGLLHQFSGFISCLSGRGERKKLLAPGPRTSSAGMTICWASITRLLQKGKPITVRQGIELGLTCAKVHSPGCKKSRKISNRKKSLSMLEFSRMA